MKKILVILILLIPGILSAKTLKLSAESGASSVTLEWNPVEGALFYDVYNGDDGLARLDSSLLSYRVENLPPDTGFDFCVVARDGKDGAIDIERKSAVTGNWSGTYRWVNLSKKDNGGKMKQYTVRVEGPFEGLYRLYVSDDEGGESLIFPFEYEDGGWINYKDDSDIARAYRVNAEKFNTSSITPSKWRIISVESGYDYFLTDIETTALGFKATTRTIMRMYEEEGTRKMEISTTSPSSLVGMFLFKNNNPGESENLILREVPGES